MDKSAPLLSFPCEFDIKVMGRAGEEFEAKMTALIRRHLPDLAEGAISRRKSTQQNYLSLNIHFTATSREQLDAIYTDLHQCSDVLMTL